jgi:hypothetical protein
MAEVRRVGLLRELAVLRELEGREAALFARRSAKLADRAELLERIADCQVRRLAMRAGFCIIDASRLLAQGCYATSIFAAANQSTSLS